MMKKATQYLVSKREGSKMCKKRSLLKIFPDRTISTLTPYNEKEQMKAYKMLYNQEERELIGVGSVIRSIANIGSQAK